MIVTETFPCLGGRWDLHDPRDVHSYMFVQLAVGENSGELVSCILRWMSKHTAP